MRISLKVPPVTSVKLFVTKWLVADGARVREGDAVYELDITSWCGSTLAEATSEVDAEKGGLLRHGVTAGSIVEMGQEVGWIEADDC